MACPSIWGLVLPCQRLACPPAAPQGVTSSSRGFHRAHHPSQGPLKEKAAFCTDSGWRWADPGYLESGDHMSRCLHPCLGITRVPRIIASGSWGGFPRDCGHPLGAVEPRRGVKAVGGRELQVPSGARLPCRLHMPCSPAPAGAGAGEQ